MENNYSTILENNIARRTEQDKPLTSFFLWLGIYIVGLVLIVIIAEDPLSFLSDLLVTILSFVIIFPMIYLQTNRVNAFIKRKAEFYTNVVEFTKQYSKDSEHLQKLNSLIYPAKSKAIINPIHLKTTLFLLGVNAVLGVLNEDQMGIILLTFTIGALEVIKIVIYEYPMNAIWDNIQIFENKFDSTLSKVWKDNGWIEESIEFHIDPSKKRNFFFYVFRSVITLGILFCVWSYKRYTDPDSMYKQFHDIEDKMLEVIKKIK